MCDRQRLRSGQNATLLEITCRGQFISHCGNNGQYEALFQSVPMIGLSVFVYRKYNAARIQVVGFGIYLNRFDFTQENLVAAIFKILHNNMF